MIKIERLSPDARVTFLRNGVEQTAFLYQLLTFEESQTMVVHSGKVLYTVDETEIVERVAKEQPKSTVETATTAPVPAPAPSTPPATPAKKIVYPKKR